MANELVLSIDIPDGLLPVRYVPVATLHAAGTATATTASAAADPPDTIAAADLPDVDADATTPDADATATPPDTTGETGCP